MSRDLSDDELLHRMASPGASVSSSAKVEILRGSFSGTASMTSQASLTDAAMSSTARTVPRRDESEYCGMLVSQ